MSKFDLRDISERLANSSDTEAVVFEFLSYLQSVEQDWRASLSFYEVSQDALVNVYKCSGNRLVRYDVTVPVDQLPARLVRKFFHPSAFLNQGASRSVFSQWMRSSPSYEPDPLEGPQLEPVTAFVGWQSCICLPLADREDMIAMLVIASEKKKAFGGRVVAELIPLKSMAAMALAQHLRRSTVGDAVAKDVESARVSAAEFQDRIRRLHEQTQVLEEDNRQKAEKLAALGTEMEQLDRSSGEYRQELDRVKFTILALEEQTMLATQHLSDAFNQLDRSQTRIDALERSLGFMKDVFDMLAQEHDPEDLPRNLVAWLCQQLEVERCSLMLADGTGETLRIAAQCGIDPVVAGRVKVRVGQGIAGWVAHNRKPLFVRVSDEVAALQRTVQDSYNSESFVCTPLVYNDRLLGVLNLSNKRGGDPFEAADLDRAVMVSAVMAITLAGQEAARRTTAWTS